MSYNSKAILDGINNKELKAWEELYSSYYSALCVYANRFIKDADCAQDVVQETLINVWKSDRTFPDMKDLTWYLYKAVYNNSLYHLRSRHSHDDIHLHPHLANSMPDEVFVDTVHDEVIRQLYVHLQELPEERRKIMMLTIEGFSGNEIAEKLGISINTVKTQKNRSFKFLREKLSGSVFLILLELFYS